jgi:hypothetical protein
MTEHLRSTYDRDVLIPEEQRNDETLPTAQASGPASPAPTTVDPFTETHEAE